MKKNKLIMILLLVILFAFSINNKKTLGIYRETLNTKVYLSILDPSSNVMITYDVAGGNESFDPLSIPVGSTVAQYGGFPVPTRSNYNFMGWYTATTGGTKVDPSTAITSSATLHAQWAKIVCKKVTSSNKLHTETCDSDSGKGCRQTYSNNSLITYGNVSNDDIPVAGDAYDCDVDNDGVYDPADPNKSGRYIERFYFLREIENSGSDNTASLVYYTSFDDDGRVSIPPKVKDIGSYAYDTAITKLPTSGTWDNPSLVDFTGNGGVSRFISMSDLTAACGPDYTVAHYLNNCEYLMENSRFQSEALGRAGIWLKEENGEYHRIHTSSVNIASVTDTSDNMARPVIEIPMSALEGFVNETKHTITFNSHGGSSVDSIKRYYGHTIGTFPTDPTYEHHEFDGWYSEYANGVYSNKVTTSTVVTGDMTLHAKWNNITTRTVTFNATGGTINGGNTYDLIVDYGDTINPLPVPTWSGKFFMGWYKTYENGEYSDILTVNDVIESNMTVYAKWGTASYVAMIEGVDYYETLDAAIAAVPTSGEKTRIILLDDIALTSSATISSNKWVELDGGNHTISGTVNLFTNNGKLDIISGTLSANATNATAKTIVNNRTGILNISGGVLNNFSTGAADFLVVDNTYGGTLNITGGTLNNFSQSAAINNKTGVLNVSGGQIIAHHTSKGQAIYMESGTVNISANAYLESVSQSSGTLARAAVDNNGGVLVITGGTIVSKAYDAVMSRKAAANTTIGVNDGLINITTPVLRGYRYGLEKTAGTVSVYDGIFESYEQDVALTTSDVTKPSNIDFKTDGTINIDGTTYNTAYLLAPSVTIRFYPENGESTISRTVDNGVPIGSQMPNDPTKDGYYFDGWYDGNTLITSDTIVTSTFDAYAKWVQSVSNATISGTLNVEIGSSESIIIPETDIEKVTYSSSNNNVATVNENGVISSVAVGSATITITGEKSHATRPVVVNVTPIMHTVTFLNSDNSPITTVDVVDGSSLGALMPANPTDDNLVFNAWYINGNSMNTFNSEVTVLDDITVVASWKEKISYASLTTSPNPMDILVGNTGQITINPTNQGGIVEEHSFTSSNSNIASVNSNGVVTGVGVGSATITVSGSLSSSTQTVAVNVDVLKHTVTFKDGDSVITSIEVPDNTAIGNLMPSDPSKNNYLFDAWYVNGSSLYPVSSETVVEGDMIALASWTPTIELATIPTEMVAPLGGTNAISVVGPDNMESYTFASSDDTIATVDSSGIVTGVALGSATITVTGSRSHVARDVEVTVSNIVTMRTVTFLDSDNETVIDTVEVVDGNALGALMPDDPTKTNYFFNAWYINGNSMTPFTDSVVVSGGDVTVVASWIAKINIAEITTVPDPLRIRVGETGQITVAGPNGGLVEDYIFSSSNTNVAEVDANGVVYGGDSGTVTVTVTGTVSGQNQPVQVIVHNTKYVTFDPDNGEEATIIEVPNGSSIDDTGVTLPSDPTKTGGYIFDRWYYYDGNDLTDTPLDTSKTITQDETYKASWASSSDLAAIGKQYYSSVALAIENAPVSTETEIRILQNISSITCNKTDLPSTCSTNGRTTIPSDKNIVVNGQDYTVSCGSSSNGNIFYSIGTLTLKNGVFTCGKAGMAPLETSNAGHIIVESGTVSNTNDRGAIYNAGTVTIHGGVLSSSATIRPVVQNAANGAKVIMTGGSVIQTHTGAVNATNDKNDGRGAIKVINSSSATITGGTVISYATNSAAVYATGGTFTIGTQNNAYNVTNPLIQGENYGIDSSVTYSIYDGIIKGKTDNQAVNNFSKINETTGIESGATRKTDTDGDFYTLYYDLAQSKYHINFNANDGTVSPLYKEFNVNTTITVEDLPTPTRELHTFVGWFTDQALTVPFAEFTPQAAATVTYYAKWSFNSSTTPVVHRITSNALNAYFNNINSYVTADMQLAVNVDNNLNNDDHTTYNSNLRTIFDNNSCSECNGANTCTSPGAGTYCDQPNEFDTGLTDDLNVYLYENNQKGSLVTYTSSDDGIIYNMIPGVTYYWESKTDNTKYGVVTATGERRTLKTAVRNLRDLGGMAASYTVGGNTTTGTIKYGKLYRGAQITTSAGVTDLNKLGVTREIDLRSDTDNASIYRLDNFDIGTKSNHTDIVITNYLINPVATDYISSDNIADYRNVKAALRKTMEYVVNGDSIFFHCTIGTDRTGTLAYFLEGLLGVSEEDRLRDYELTYFYGLTNRTRYHNYLDGSKINPRFYAMYKSYPTNQDIYDYFTYETYTPNPGEMTDDELLAAFRSAMIE